MNIPALNCIYCGKSFRTTEEDRDFCYNPDCEDEAFSICEYESDDDEEEQND